MTTTIYVMSTERFSGKTALSIALIHWLRRNGLTAGYMKPISTTAHAIGDRVLDEDAVFVKSALGLTDPLETMVPFFLTDQETKAVLERADTREIEVRVLNAYRAVAAQKDAVILEGGTSLREGWIINLAPPRLCALTGAHALVVVPYLHILQVVDDLLAARSWLGESMVGSVINSVPKHLVGLIQEKVKPFVGRNAVPVFAVIPREKALLSVSIRELVRELEGEVLC